MGLIRKKTLAIVIIIILVLLAFSTISTNASAMTKAELIEKVQATKGMPELTKKKIISNIEDNDHMFGNWCKKIDTDEVIVDYSYGNFKVREDADHGSPGYDTMFLIVTSYKRDGDYFIIKYTVIVIFTQLTLDEWCEAIEYGFSDRGTLTEDMTWSKTGKSLSAELDMDPPSEDTEDPSTEPPSTTPGDPPNGTSEEQWKVMKFLREYYQEYEVAPMIRKLCKETGFKLKKIYEMFPSGPAKGAQKIGGPPKPTGCV